MTSQIATDFQGCMIDDLRGHSAQLIESLQKEEMEEANSIIQSLVNRRDQYLYQSIGKLTRGLHDAMVNFDVDAKGEKVQKSIEEYQGNEATNNLEYVIQLTQNAADKTMDMVDSCTPLACELGEQAGGFKEQWLKLRNREMSADQFRELYKNLDGFFDKLGSNSSEINTNLQNIILEQGFQDLSGQVLKKVIKLVSEVESDLVELLKTASKIESVTGISVLDEGKDKSQQQDEQGPDIVAEGPKHNAKERNDVADSQDDVDDLLSSLGF